ncbi:MAG: FixH family protein [Novosphingobium sp.]
MQRTFTGRHMLAIFVVFFGIVIAVNFAVARVALHSFSGVVVENSYVASQDFNHWLKDAKSEQALGWNAKVSRDGAGRLVVDTAGMPEGTKLVAQLRRPLGTPDDRSEALHQVAPGRYQSREVDPGRWIVRIEADANGTHWARELPVG